MFGPVPRRRRAVLMREVSRHGRPLAGLLLLEHAALAGLLAVTVRVLVRDPFADRALGPYAGGRGTVLHGVLALLGGRAVGAGDLLQVAYVHVVAGTRHGDAQFVQLLAEALVGAGVVVPGHERQ